MTRNRRLRLTVLGGLLFALVNAGLFLLRYGSSIEALYESRHAGDVYNVARRQHELGNIGEAIGFYQKSLARIANDEVDAGHAPFIYDLLRYLHDAKKTDGDCAGDFRERLDSRTVYTASDAPAEGAEFRYKMLPGRHYVVLAHVPSMTAGPKTALEFYPNHEGRRVEQRHVLRFCGAPEWIGIHVLARDPVDQGHLVLKGTPETQARELRARDIKWAGAYLIGRNRLDNQGFEDTGSPPRNWGIGAGPSCEVSRGYDNVMEGTRSLRLRFQSSGTAVLEQRVHIEEGLHTLEGWFRTRNAGPDTRIAIAIESINRKVSKFETALGPYAGNGEWKQIDEEFESPGPASIGVIRIAISVEAEQSPATVWLDGFTYIRPRDG